MSWEVFDAKRKTGDLGGALHAHVDTAKEEGLLRSNEASAAHKAISQMFNAGGNGGLSSGARSSLKKGDASQALSESAKASRMSGAAHARAGRDSIASQSRTQARGLEAASKVKLSKEMGKSDDTVLMNKSGSASALDKRPSSATLARDVSKSSPGDKVAMGKGFYIHNTGKGYDVHRVEGGHDRIVESSAHPKFAAEMGSQLKSRATPKHERFR